jgi:uncharacterized BrkB/YihY/UPF0761 family membrane protein
VLNTKELTNLVAATTQHTGILGIIGLRCAVGGSSVGGAISTVFQAVFEVNGRSFIKEKLIDIGMIFVFTALMIVIIVGTTAGALVKTLFTSFRFPSRHLCHRNADQPLCRLLLFACIYLVFPTWRPASSG